VSARSLRTVGLTKRYGDRNVVDRLDLEVHPGEVVGLLGPNGAGKTTSFSMIVGGLRPTQGRVFLGDRDVTLLPMFQRARLGVVYLPQEPSVFRKLSVADNISAILETVERDPTLRRERLGELLSELGLTDKAHRRADSLSGGERRRVEITRALVLDPRFLLLDEPFTGIDPIAVIDIQKMVEQLKIRGIGIVITEHKVREALAICDRAYVIQDGRVIRQGSPREIATDPQVREIYLGQNFELGS
jgi:lipopolysaccharide export system ATP-binding protein